MLDLQKVPKWLLGSLALLSAHLHTSAQAGVIGWGEKVSNSAWHGDRFQAIAAGAQHTVALRNDGTVVAWGDNRGNEPDSPIGQCSDIPPLPAGLTYVAVAGGLRHSVALRSDGVIAIWGDTHNRPYPPTPFPCVEIAAGGIHTVARLSDGSVTVGGAGEPSAPPLPSGLAYVEIAAGGTHSLARRSDGAVVAWGRSNAFGQSDVPALPAGLTYVQIAAGGNHSVARRSDGSVVAWGDNRRAQCDVPVLPIGVTYVDIEAGGNHTLARRSDQSAVAWGDDSAGQLDLPALPAGLAYVELAAGNAHSVARRSDGSVVCFGDNSWDQCNAAPEPSAGTSYRQITANRVALQSDGSVVVWSGSNASAIRAVPVLPAGLSYVEVASMAEGLWAMARRSDGSVVAWGSDACGLLAVPALPAGLAYVEIAAGSGHGLARRSDGTVVAWGCNTFGECDVPPLPAGVTYTQIAASAASSGACRSDGEAVVWGRIGFGEGQPPAPPGDLRYVEIAMSNFHTVLRRSDGVVVGCGASLPCPFPLPPAGRSYVELAAAQRFRQFDPPSYATSVARLSDGSVVTLGGAYPNDQHLPALPPSFEYAGIAATPGVTFALVRPTTTALAPDLVEITPTRIDALIPGTQRTIALDGTGLDLTTSVLLDDVEIDPARYRIVSSALVLLDMPQTPDLGAHKLTVSDGRRDDSMPVTVVAPAAPRYELGTGDARNVVERRDGLRYLLAGPVGSVQDVYASLSGLPSTSSLVSLALGNQFTSLAFVGQFVIPAAGWLSVTTPGSALPATGPAGIVFYSQTIELARSRPLRVSNLQSIELVQRAGDTRRP